MTANGQMAATSPRGTSCYLLLSFVYPPGRAPRDHLTPIVDSPRTVVPVRTGMRMPGSFGCGDDDEVNELIQGIRELGVMDN
jgi:hypothetical protein